jgi:hypothetical protein
MGTVFKKTATKQLPMYAKLIVRIGKRYSEWIDAQRKSPLTIAINGLHRVETNGLGTVNP